MQKSRLASAAVICFVVLSVPGIGRAEADWDPISEDEKSMNINPMDPGSGAVVLFKRGEVRVEERTSNFWLTTMETYVRIKVFNESGLDAANISFDTNKYLRFNKVDGRTILPSGQIVPLDTTKVFRTTAYESGSGTRIQKTSFALPAAEPGAILEYRLLQTADGFYPPPWFFDTPALGTLRSSLSVLVGPRLALAQFPMDTNRNKIEAKHTRLAAGTQFNYAVKELLPIREEPYAIPFADQACVLLFSPYEVLFSDQVFPIIQKWNDVAKLLNEWYKQSLKKSKEAENRATELAGKIADARQRAETIYRFIQQNVASTEVRGVGIIRAPDEVLADKRGDPDEINSLFVTMLREVKIDADPVLVAARDAQSLTGKFPNLVQFTGMLTRIRLGNSKGSKEGTIVVYADPADPAAAFGELAWYHQGVVGVAINGDKAEDAMIPVYSAESNTIETRLDAELKADGSVESRLESSYQGADAQSIRRHFQDEAADKIEQKIIDYLDMGLPESEFSNIEYPEFKDTDKPVVLKAELHFQLLDESGPGQLLLNPWVADRQYTPAFTSTERKSAVRFDFLKTRISTSTWRLPEGITVEELPKEVNIKSDLGEFSRACTEKDEVVSCKRKFVLNKMILQNMGEYRDAKQFFEQVAKDDQEVILLTME